MACPKHAVDVSSYYGNKEGDEGAAGKGAIEGTVPGARLAQSILVLLQPP